MQIVQALENLPSHMLVGEPVFGGINVFGDRGLLELCGEPCQVASAVLLDDGDAFSHRFNMILLQVLGEIRAADRYAFGFRQQVSVPRENSVESGDTDHVESTFHPRGEGVHVAALDPCQSHLVLSEPGLHHLGQEPLDVFSGV